MNLLSVTGVSHDYPHHGRVLHEIQLAIAPGETVALLGRSGCGKSTLARMLVGLETPQHGDIVWRGTPLTALKGEAVGAFRRDIQLVFQDAFSAVNPRKTVREIVSEPLRHLLRLSREERARQVEEMLQAVDLSTMLLDKRPAQLSGGQLQRVCLARALAVRPQLLILDEAVSNLDLLLQAEIIALLKRLQAQFGTACLFITHDLRLVERFCQRVLVMEHGRIVETLTLDDDLLAALDALSARRGYHNRSEAVRDILRDALNQDPAPSEPRRGYAVLSYVYEHEKRELASRLVATQHHHHDLSVATLHVHISHDDCLEIAVLKGDMVEIQHFADDVIAQRGVRHGHLQCLADD